MTKLTPTRIIAVSIFFISGLLLGAPVAYAQDVQPEPDPAESAALEEAEANLQADLAEIAANREAIIEELLATWPSEPGAEEDIRTALSQADDEALLAMRNASSFDEAIGATAGDDSAEVRTDRDYVFTPVVPCRIVDTRAPGVGAIFPGPQRIFYSYGSGFQIGLQGGSPSGCSSPRGEPRGIFIQIVAVTPFGKGNVQAAPIGASLGMGVNFSPSAGTNLANAGAIRTSYFHPTGRDFGLRANANGTHVTVTILGYYHEINGEDIAASDSSGTITGGLSVGSGSSNYTTLASRTVSVPVNGRVVIMGEASWLNNGSNFLGCRFLENGSQVDFWWWDAGDSDIYIDQHQNRFYHKTVSAGTRTYALQCYRSGGTSATAYYRNVTVMFFEEDL
jgi:hypothetical protein